jgi:hypothetical protein
MGNPFSVGCTRNLVIIVITTCLAAPSLITSVGCVGRVIEHSGIILESLDDSEYFGFFNGLKTNSQCRRAGA